jgi:predicted Zn-dependent protease
VRCLAILFAILVVAPCSGADRKERDPSRIGRHNAGGGVNFYSRAREIELGRDLARDVERESQLIDDPVVSEYINRIGQNLVNNSDAQFSVSIKVIRSEEVNAFALPGGYVFVNSALIRSAATEAELAGALAHEIGHVAARHYTREESLRDLFSVASVPLIFVGGLPAFAVQRGLEIASPLASRKFSRAAEGQADVLGVQYLYRAGYDPLALIDFLERISLCQKSNPGVFAGLIAMHPAVTSRIRAIQKEIERELRPREQYLFQTSEFVKIQERLAAIEGGNAVPRKFPRSPIDSSDTRPILKRRNPGP